ncbi:hypothetical protein Sjap_024712 [Stephania japonica]|uniref:FAD-binding PCMH-type domain-containing protein n=1 Tax=Stephania japonica TaxID=461633 RepID=A0AAP0EG26_9MAGN
MIGLTFGCSLLEALEWLNIYYRGGTSPGGGMGRKARVTLEKALGVHAKALPKDHHATTSASVGPGLSRAPARTQGNHTFSALTPASSPDVMWKVADFITPAQQWNTELLNRSLYFIDVVTVGGIPFPATPQEDFLAWHTEKNGKYSLRLKKISVNALQLIPINPCHKYVPKSPSFLSVLQSSIYNLRFTSPTRPKPQFIITPNLEFQIQAVVVCSKQHSLKFTVRSGGHDFEGLSYRSNVPFVLIDLVNFRTIDVNIQDNIAWVEASATLDEVYYKIAEKSLVHGLPAGACPTVGVGRHISGGGFGLMVRKFGMAADHVLDAKIINAKGKILARKVMGEDLFWAIREQGATEFVHMWQSVASYGVPNELSIALHIGMVDKANNGTESGSGRTIQATFTTLFLDPATQLIQVVVTKDHLQSKIQFVMRPIPKVGLERVWKRFLKEERPELAIGVWGGKVNQISEDKIAFPHRASDMYLIGMKGKEQKHQQSI